MPYYPPGFGPAGYAPVQAPSAATPGRVKTPAAVMFDIKTGRFVMDEDGAFVEVHPVDQMVALSFGVEEGDYKSAPTVGHTLRRTRPADPGFEADAKDRIQSKLSALVRRGDVRIDDVTVNVITGDPALKGRVEFVVKYTNLRVQNGARSYTGLL